MAAQIRVGDQLGNYSIVRHIGGGGMAQIYLAKTIGVAGFEKHLALKVINPEYANEERFVRMLINEAKIAVGLSHVNIAQIFDLGVYEGVYYIAMEYVDGVDVLELVNSLHAIAQNVPVEAVAYIGRQICSGLHYAHTRRNKRGQPLNIVHRDISPQNILVSRAGEVKVVDFGIAKAVGVTTKTQAGVIKGKVNYMSPEQVSGEPADARSDIFAVGIVLWEMLTAQMVYAGDDMAELATKVRKAAIPPVSSVRRDVPPTLERIVMTALRRQTSERYQTAHQLQVELTKFLSATAPEYSGSHLARLVEMVAHRESGVGDIAEIMSHADRIEDHHSLISDIEEGPAQIVYHGENGDEIYPLDEEMTIGRAGDLAVGDARVSRRHARVWLAGSRYVVEDLGSSNGTFVNGERLAGKRALQPGDRLRVGNCELSFQVGRTDRSAAAQAETPVPDHLIISVGGRETEHSLEPNLEVRYRLQVGPLQLRGSCGRIVWRHDAYWFEAGKGQLQATINGEPTPCPARLSVGDRIELQGVTLKVMTHQIPTSA